MSPRRSRLPLTVSRSFVILGQVKTAPLWKSKKLSSPPPGKINARCRCKRSLTGTAPRRRRWRSSSRKCCRAGIEEIVHGHFSPATRRRITTAAGAHAPRLKFVEQAEPLGYGHAVHCARGVRGTRSVSAAGGRSSLSEPWPEELRAAIGGGRARRRSAPCRRCRPRTKASCRITARSADGWCRRKQRLYEVEDVLEKPTPTEAEQKIDCAGPARGPLPVLFWHARAHAGGDGYAGRVRWPHEGRGARSFSAALARLANHERYLACELDGRPLRYRREVRLADRATRAGARRARTATKCCPGWWNCWR